ncbi:hypothetical protein BOTNAR_0063g00380 [Botryotinia narcissicola]|uniref:Cytochrome P450 n=1 Tax=Botryotinia narcissicola TaxID=278944 RepID=A0A4Z1IXZ2_9HELO|nr:hypothetical protein BOTNAR_0063g00380 [Botryotinia narcissicola]
MQTTLLPRGTSPLLILLIPNNIKRWEGSELKGIEWGFMPFHGRPRICLGQDSALMEASYAVVRIIQNFPNIRLPPGIPVYSSSMEKQTLIIVVSSAEGFKVLL